MEKPANPTNVDMPVPKPDYQSIASVDDQGEPELLPKLRRDDPGQVNETLQRLKHSQVAEITTPTGQRQIRAATGLISQSEISSFRNRRTIIGALLILIILVIGAIALRVSLPAEFSGNGSQSRVTFVKTNNNDLVADLTTTTRGYLVLPQPNNREALLAQNTETFGLLDLNFSPTLIATINSPVSLFIDQENKEFAIAFIIIDNPNTVAGLRSWETATDIRGSSPLISKDRQGVVTDATVDGLDFRVLGDSLTYAVDDQDGSVVIANNPAVAIREKQALITNLFRP